jgi:hypothetical protein
MNKTSVLVVNWEAYDVQKKSAGEDNMIFNPEISWEFNYLVEFIKSEKPQLDLITIMLAIRKAIRETYAPRQRQHFIGAVMGSIHEREQDRSQIFSVNKKGQR